MPASCPICFEEAAHDGSSSKFLIRGKYCSHGFCKPCLDKILLLVEAVPGSDEAEPSARPPRRADQPPPAEGNDDPSPNVERHPSDVTIVGVPTQGSCPICRARLSLFDAMWLDTSEGLEEKLPEDLVYRDEIVTDWKQTPLVGKVYADSRGVGYSSYHFDPNHPDYDVPYLNSSVARAALEGGSGSFSDWKFPFLEFQWHTPTRTMVAVINPGIAHGGTRHELIMAFSSNLHFVRTGASLFHRTEFSSLEELYERHPYDGTYRVVCLTGAGAGMTTTHVIRRDRVATRDQMNGFLNVIAYVEDNSELMIMCPDKPDWSLMAKYRARDFPSGPQNGDTIRFQCPLLGVIEDWTMERKVTSTKTPSDVTYLGPGTGKTENYCRLWTAAEVPMPDSPQYNTSALWGNAFCQWSGMSQEAYHFALPSIDGEPGRGKIVAYASFGNPTRHPFPSLNDGSDLPDRIHFKNATYDTSTLTFVGSIKWLDDCGTTFRGMKRWDVKVRFDSEFACIVSGLIKGYPVSGDGTGQKLSVFGKDRLYFNARLGEHFCSLLGVDPDAFDPPPHDPQLVRKAAALWAQLQNPVTAAPVLQRAQPLLDRLSREGAKPRAVDECRRIWISACTQLAALGAP